MSIKQRRAIVNWLTQTLSKVHSLVENITKPSRLLFIYTICKKYTKNRDW